MARSLNCVNGPTSKPCGKCNSCVSLAANGPGNLDVTELDAASHNGVDDMRELRDRAMFAPAESRYRIFIIDEAHMITNQGSNALLKIVEEPPAHLIFIFATTEPEKVIGTIRSRTHHYPFRLLTPQAMRGLLERTVAAEGAIIEESVYPLVIRAGGGSPRDTLSILDQLLAGTGPDGLTYQYARMLLGVTDDTLIDATIAALATNDRASLFTTVDDVIEAGLSPRKFSEDLLDRLRDLMLLQAVPDAVNLGLVDAPTDRGEILLKQAQEFDSQRIPRIAGILNDGLSSLKGATSPRLLLEILCAKMLIEPGGMVLVGEPAGQVAPAPAPSAQPARPMPAAPASTPSSKYERPSQRRAREAQEARNVAEKPEVVEVVAEAKPREPEESPETRSTPPQPASTSVHVQPIDTIKNAWDKIRSTVSKTNAVAGILLTGAQPLGIADDTLLLGHNTGALASRLNAPEHNATIQSAVLETTGLELEVRCEVGTNPKAFGFETDSPRPVWNPEQDAGEAGSAGDTQETAVQEAESTNPVAAEQAEPAQPEPAPETAESGSAPEPAKSDADSESAQSPEGAAEPEAMPPAPGPALEVAPEPAPPASPAPAAPEDTWGEPARLGGAPESAPDMPKPDGVAVPEDASEAGPSPAAQPSQPPSAASPAAPTAESATSIWGQPAQLGGAQPANQPTHQAQPAQPAHERPAPQAQTQPQPSAKPTTSTWRERARRGNKLLAEQQNAPRFSDGTPAPPEPSEPWDAPPPPPPPAEVPEMSAPEPGAEAGFGAAPVPGAAPGQPMLPTPKEAPESPKQRESSVSAGPASPGASAPTTSLASAVPARSSQNAAPAPSSTPDSGSDPGAGTAGAPTSNAPSHRHHQHHQSRQPHRSGDEEAEMMHQAATELGEHDHRDAMTIAISLVEQELGGRVV